MTDFQGKLEPFQVAAVGFLPSSAFRFIVKALCTSPFVNLTYKMIDHCYDRRGIF